MNNECSHVCESCRLERMEKLMQGSLAALTDAADAMSARLDAQAEALDRANDRRYSYGSNTDYYGRAWR